VARKLACQPADLVATTWLPVVTPAALARLPPVPPEALPEEAPEQGRGRRPILYKSVRPVVWEAPVSAICRRSGPQNEGARPVANRNSVLA
jgi:hypothetical protein